MNPELQALKKRLAQGSVLAFLLNSVGVSATFLTQLFLARVLPVAEYGQFAYMLSWVMILSVVATIGTDTALVRFIPKARAKDDWRTFGNLVRLSLLSTAVVSVALLVCIQLILFWQNEGSSTSAVYPLQLALLGFPIWALLRVRLAILRALRKVTLALISDRIAREVTLLLGSICIAYFAEPGNALDLLAWLVVLACTVSLIFGTLSEKAVRPAEVVADRAWLTDRKAFFLTAVQLLMLVSLQNIYGRIDIIIATHFISDESAGILNICLTVSKTLVFPLLAINFLLAPYISALQETNDFRKMQYLLTITSIWSTTCASFCILPMLIAPEWILSLFGEAYEVGAPILRIIAVGQLFSAACGSVVPVLTMTGHERDALKAIFWAMLLKVVATLVFVGEYGLDAIALFTALSIIGWNLALCLQIWRRLGILPSIMGTWRTISGTARSE